MGENSSCVDQAMFKHHKTFCILYGCSNASAIDCNSSSMHCEHVTSSDSSLCVTRVSHMYYLSSSNSPVNVRIGKHTHKGRGLVLLVTGPAKINHLNANYTEVYFC